MNIKATVQFCKDIFITASVEINIKKYESCQIHCWTICPTFESIQVKRIIHPVIYLRIMRVVNLIEYFVGDVGEEVMPQTIIVLSMFLFPPIMIFSPLPYPFY